MRKVLIVAITIFVGGVFSSACGGVALRLRGGGNIDADKFGGGVSLDIPISVDEERSTGISLFGDYHAKSEYKFLAGGINVLYMQPADENSYYYFVAGGGIAHATAEKYGDSQSEVGASIDFGAGYQYKISEMIGIFAEAKYLQGFVGSMTFRDPSFSRRSNELTSANAQDINFHIGITFSLGN